MAERSKVRLRFRAGSLPFLEGALEYANQWLFPGGTCRNRDRYQRWVGFDPAVPEEVQMLLYMPETSGGLLIALAPDRAQALAALCGVESQQCWAVGEVLDGEGVEVVP